MAFQDLESSWVAAAPGILVAGIGVVGLVVTLVVRDVWRTIMFERNAVFDLRLEIERREAAVAEQARNLAEWEGRLHQVAECGCCPSHKSGSGAESLLPGGEARDDA